MAASPAAQVLIATGSPRAQAFSLPERVDSVKLPAVTKDGAGCYQPRKITAGLDELVELRASLLVAACATFRPDVIVVDQAPTGMAGELIPMLRMIDNLAVRPRLVLGLRDIVDDAASVGEQWSRQRIWEWLERYDDIAVYGDPQILTTADELSLASRLPARVTHTGYVAPNMPEASSCEPFILVTPGGGGDGQALIRSYLDGVDAVTAAGLKSLIVTGPLMSASRRAELVGAGTGTPEIEVIEFSDNMRQLVASSIGVVSMAGYDTVVERLASGTPSMLVRAPHHGSNKTSRGPRLGPHANLERCPVEQLCARGLRHSWSER